MAEHRQHDQPSPPARRGWKRGPAVHGIGRSRGGATTKVHLVVDALGLPLAFELTEGQRHDIVPAPCLVERTRPRCLLADKAYSTHDFRALLDTRPRGSAHLLTTRSCTRHAPRSSARSTYSNRHDASRLATRRRCGITVRSSPSAARGAGCESRHRRGSRDRRRDRNATVIVIRPVDGSHATVAPSGR